MTPIRRSFPGHLTTLSFLVAAWLVWPTSAFALLPDDMARQIAATAASANNATASQPASSRTPGYQSLNWIKARRAQDSGNSALESVVVSAISARPDLAAEIISAAVKAAPASALTIARHTAHVFPGFAPVIARSAGLPLSSVSTSAYAEYTASSTYQVQPAVAPAALAPAVATPTVYRPVYPVVRSTQPAPQSAAAPQPQNDDPAKRIIADDQKIAPGFHGPEKMSDPIEGFNRVMFSVNDALDVMILRPVAAIYSYLMPPPAKPAAQRFFTNLGAPVVMLNDLVQLDGEDAAVTAGRFVINSTVGVLGLFDVAEDFGLPEHHADFGQSLHSYGMGPGPYIVLPLMGPSSLRDGTGKVVDGFIDPFNYILKADVRTAREVGSALVGRESLIPGLHNLRNKSVDFYAALRSAYYQNRVLKLNKGRAGLADTTSRQTDDMFDQAE
jgi:phospholipid-binding lipoprotein MlaA